MGGHLFLTIYQFPEGGVKNTFGDRANSTSTTPKGALLTLCDLFKVN